jgi:hypothetical protein
VTAADLLAVPWYVVVDDCIGGVAVANVDKPTSQHDHSAGEGEIASFLHEEAARYIVALHNASLVPNRMTPFEADMLNRARKMHAAECPCGREVEQHRHWLTLAAAWLTASFAALSTEPRQTCPTCRRTSTKAHKNQGDDRIYCESCCPTNCVMPEPLVPVVRLLPRRYGMNAAWRVDL